MRMHRRDVHIVIFIILTTAARESGLLVLLTTRFLGSGHAGEVLGSFFGSVNTALLGWGFVRRPSQEPPPTGSMPVQ